jgi:cobalt-precorrin 5A hydrolase
LAGVNDEGGGRRLVVVAVTRRGIELAQRLAAAVPGVEIHVAARWRALLPKAKAMETPLVEALPGLFREPSVGGLIVVLAVGATVRLLAPWLQGKDRDAAVVCVDDGGRFAVAVLSGHRGGANALARRVADALGACAVITTASDADGVLAVDLLGADAGWRIEATPAALRHAAAAVVNGDPVGFYQDAGNTGWQSAADMPSNVQLADIASSRTFTNPGARTNADPRRPTLELTVADEMAALLVISDRVLNLPARPDCIVVYRPPTLVAGVGCSRGATADDIATTVDQALMQGGLARASLASLATLDRRLDEPGIVEYAHHMGLPVTGFAAAQLASVRTVPNPSAVVNAAVGTPGVCEPAALLASGARSLLVAKVKTARATAAIARIPSATEVRKLSATSRNAPPCEAGTL